MSLKPQNKHTNKMNKNAYEIRLELLQMAHNDYNNAYCNKIDALREADHIAYAKYEQKCQHLRETRDVGLSRLSEPKRLMTPDVAESLLPDPALIRARAEALYAFVQGA